MSVADPTYSPPPRLSALELIELNRTAVGALLDYTTLPYSAPPVCRPEMVFVHVATPADLERWRSTLRDHGVLTASVECDRTLHGLDLWTLRTVTPPGIGGYQARLLVHTTAPAGVPLPPELAHLDPINPLAVAS